MPHYVVRRATLADRDTLVRHRIRMFEDMGVLAGAADTAQLASGFGEWLDALMPSATYVAWLVDAHEGDAVLPVSGGGAAIVPWPPGPRYPGTRLAYVYNVYTEPEHRGRGLARRVMQAIHDFCRTEGIGSLALNASKFGQPLYEALGYRVAQSPMMFLSLE
jgi:GNAT superfamily N-acetyltransferase